MKAITNHLITNSEKDLFVGILLVSSIAIGVCAKMGQTKSVMPIKIHYVDPVDNFDQKSIPNDPPVIAQMINVLRPEFSHLKAKEVANKISKAFAKYKIEPQIVVSIIDAESSFNQDLISSTGDLSMAQVNVDIWNKEFERMKLNPIEAERLKADQEYSLEVMAQILHILKKRYQKKDRKWYARYHSKTEKHKSNYLSKLNTRLKRLARARVASSHHVATLH